MTNVELTEKGYTVLRSQLDSRKNGDKQWKISKFSNVRGGGWRRFGDSWYFTRKDADDAIDRIIELNPGMKYTKEQ